MQNTQDCRDLSPGRRAKFKCGCLWHSKHSSPPLPSKPSLSMVRREGDVSGDRDTSNRFSVAKLILQVHILRFIIVLSSKHTRHSGCFRAERSEFDSFFFSPLRPKQTFSPRFTRLQSGNHTYLI
jgi:hypothetical protein